MNNIETVNVERNLLLKHPFTMMVAGATSSGKTVFVRNLLKSQPAVPQPAVEGPWPLFRALKKNEP